MAGYTCKFCGKSFINGRSLGGHIKHYHLAELKQKSAKLPAEPAKQPAEPAKQPLPEAPLPSPANPNPPIYYNPTATTQNTPIQPSQQNQWGPLLQFLSTLMEKGGKKEPDPMSQLAYQFFQKLVERQVDRIVSNLDMLEQYRAKGAAEAEKQVVKEVVKEGLQQQIKQPKRKKKAEENVSREIIPAGAPAH
jgi:hypothetical protein